LELYPNKTIKLEVYPYKVINGTKRKPSTQVANGSRLLVSHPGERREANGLITHRRLHNQRGLNIKGAHAALAPCSKRKNFSALLYNSHN
jgi:hypothetical protein